MENMTADSAATRSKLNLGLSRRPLNPQTDARIFELDDDFDRVDQQRPTVSRPSSAARTTDDEATGVSVLRRGVALASDAVVLTLASPFFAAWLIFRGARALFRWAVPGADTPDAS